MKEIELIDKREPNVKHFLQPDGTIKAVVYDTNIHYLKDGKYEEIDNTLVKKGNHYENKSNDYKVLFNDRTRDSLVTVEKGQNYLEIGLKNANDSKLKKAKKAGNFVSDVLYSDILANVDIEYKTLPNKLKETIILKESGVDELEFYVNTNLELEIENNSIIAKTKNNRVFVIDKPFMVDSDNKRNDKIFYKVENIGESYKIKLVLDSDWLLSDERIYPVYIDPTITDALVINNVEDTFIYPGDTNVDRNSLGILKAGVERYNNVETKNRTLVKFVLPTIPTGCQIVRADMCLYGYPAVPNPSVAKSCVVHRVTQNWTETQADWNSMNDKFDSKIEAIIDYHRSNYYGDTMPIDLIQNVANITDLVKKWYDGLPNNGVMIKQPEEIYIDDIYPAFFSKNYNSSGFSPKPRLEITYLNQNGLEGYLHYLTEDLTDGTTYFNTYNGNLTAIFNVGSTIGAKLPVDLEIVYNTTDMMTNDGKFLFNFNQKISALTIDGITHLMLRDEDGTEHYFYKDENENLDIYYDQEGLSLKIEIISGTYYLTDKYGNTKKFEPMVLTTPTTGYLTEIKSVNNDAINVTYDSVTNKIIKIVDSSNNEINISYGANATTIASPDSQTVLTFTSDLLTSISTRNGTTQITYNSDNLIEHIIDVSGLKTEYEYYDKQFKLKSVKHYGLNNSAGEYFNINYGFESTTIVDNKNRVNTLLFNSNGNLLSSSNLTGDENINDAYSTILSYSDSNKNKLAYNVIPIKYIKNYLKNTSFENLNNVYFSSNNNLNISISDDFAVSGGYSLKLQSNNSNQSALLNTDSLAINLESEKFYTFSGYFKSTTDFKIKISYIDDNNQLYSEELPCQCSDSFVRQDISIYFDPNSTNNNLGIELILNNNGIMYVDDIQLEQGDVVNDYNIVENSDFSDGTNGWTFEAEKIDYTQIDQYYIPARITIPTSQVYEVVSFNNNRNKALKIKMDPLTNSTFQKVFPLKGKKGDIYQVSFWMKNEGVIGDSVLVSNAVTIYFKPRSGDSPYCIMHSPEFVPNNKWQFVTFKYDADEDYEEIRLIFNQSMQANNMYITNISFYKDLSTDYYDYDENGNLTSLKNSTKEGNIFNYDNNNQLIKITDTRGKTFKFEYDNEKKDCALNAISTLGMSNKIKYDNFGNPISTKIARAYCESLETGYYYIRNKGSNSYIKIIDNNVELVDSPCSNTCFFLEKNPMRDQSEYILSTPMLNKYLKYSNNGLIISSTLLEPIRFGHNDAVFLLHNMSNGSVIFEFSDGVDSRYLKIENNEFVFSYTYEDSPEYEFYFELANQKFIECDATYSADGRFLTSVKDSLMNEKTFVTDETTGLIASKQDANNNTIYYQYNNKKQVTSITQGNKSVDYTYSTNGLLSEVAQNGKEYKFTYNEFLQPVSVGIGNNIVLISNTYENNDGNLMSVTYGNNQSISYTYDDFDRISAVNKMNNNTYEYRYDSNGNLAKIKTPNDGDYKYSYDSLKRLIEFKNDNYRINYEYDYQNNITCKKYTLGNINLNESFAYDFDNNIVKIFIDNMNVNYNYDDLERISNYNINNQYNVNYSYLSLGNRTSNIIESEQINGISYSYKYDKNYNVTHIYKNGNLIKQYLYNEYNELIKEENLDTNIVIEYSYDLDGNILSKTIKDYLTNNIIDTYTYSYNNQYWGDELTLFNGTTITYDSIGNPLTIGNSISLSWINGRQLDEYNDGSVLNVNYEYNNNGIRISKIVNNVETKYYLDNTNIMFEERGNDLISYIYDLTGVIGLKHNNTVYYYLKNNHNDIIGILDSNYNQIVSYEYDSWGKLLSVKDANNQDIVDPTNIGLINPFRYRSYYYDSETGLYYLNSRYYNPEWGRFISPDFKLIQNASFTGNNMYIYANNNPINYCDPNGNASLFSNIGKFINDAKKTIQDIAKKASAYLGFGLLIGGAAITGRETTARALLHSLSSNPKNMTQNDFPGVVSEIKKSKNFKNEIDTIVNDIPNGAVNYIAKDFKFDGHGDLGLSLHKATFTATGNLSGGKGDLHITITDTYNFEYSDDTNSKNIGKAMVARVNNIACKYQEWGIIKNYDIVIEFDYSIK